MERLQGHINPCFFEEPVIVDYLEQETGLDLSYGPFLNAPESLRFEEHLSSDHNLQNTMPFLQILQGVEEQESPSLSPYTEPNIQLLLRLKQDQKKKKKPWETSYFAELESCITQLSETHSPVKSETKERHQEVASSECSREPGSDDRSGSGPARERKRRKRARVCKNKEEVESQRMTHIAVERNRRKQMNEHLNGLRSLIPASFIQRGDQASIIGGAIDFVKELEQLLQSLQAQKRIRKSKQSDKTPHSPPFNGFFNSPQFMAYSSYQTDESKGDRNDFAAGNRPTLADIEVTVIQAHVNLKILCPQMPGQLVKAISAFEELQLAILHLNITSSSDGSVLYSFNLKIEENCKLVSADEIAMAVHQIFNYINRQ